jgi:hypothetical protein
MATVGETWFDRYLLRDDRDQDEEAAGRQLTLSMKFTAKGSGRLYLYLNDAVLFLPGVEGIFYDNNNGCAWVTVREVATPASASGAGPAMQGQGEPDAAEAAREWRSCAGEASAVSPGEGS